MNLTPANLVYLENEPYILSEDNSYVLVNSRHMAVTRIDDIIEIDPKIIESLYNKIAEDYGKCYVETMDEFTHPELFKNVAWGESKPLVHFVNGKAVIHPFYSF